VIVYLSQKAITFIQLLAVPALIEPGRGTVARSRYTAGTTSASPDYLLRARSYCKPDRILFGDQSGFSTGMPVTQLASGFIPDQPDRYIYRRLP